MPGTFFPCKRNKSKTSENSIQGLQHKHLSYLSIHTLVDSKPPKPIIFSICCSSSDFPSKSSAVGLGRSRRNFGTAPPVFLSSLSCEDDDLLRDLLLLLLIRSLSGDLDLFLRGDRLLDLLPDLEEEAGTGDRDLLRGLYRSSCLSLTSRDVFRSSLFLSFRRSLLSLSLDRSLCRRSVIHETTLKNRREESKPMKARIVRRT